MPSTIYDIIAGTAGDLELPEVIQEDIQVQDLVRDDSSTLDAQVIAKAISLVDEYFQNPMHLDYTFVEMVLRTGVLMALNFAKGDYDAVMDNSAVMGTFLEEAGPQ